VVVSGLSQHIPHSSEEVLFSCSCSMLFWFHFPFEFFLLLGFDISQSHV
jgi:hypothetical protein